MTRARRIARLNERSALRAAFLRALADRVTTNRGGQVTLPTGRADAGEVAKVLRAIERARQARDRLLRDTEPPPTASAQKRLLN
jgi:hypothetical protein